MDEEALRMVSASKSPRIAILLPDLRSGGAEKLHVDLSKEWEAQGVATTFVLRQKRGQLLEQLPPSSEVVNLNAPRVRNAFFPLVRYLKGSRADALLAAMWPLTVVAPLAAKTAGFSGRTIVSEHSPLSLAYANRGWLHRQAMRYSQRIAYSRADARVAVSQGVARDLAEISGLTLDLFEVIHNPAAKGVVDPLLCRPEELIGLTGPLVLSVGTLKRVKRFDLLIDAFAQLPPSLDATLCIVGDGGERSNLERQVRELGISDRVVMPGFVRDPAPWYAHADLFVLCSDYEGFGNVLVEALEHGLPIVSTDCPVGPREILNDGRYGTLVPPDDPEGIANAIVRVASGNVDHATQRRRARDFEVQAIARRYLNICPRSGAGEP